MLVVVWILMRPAHARSFNMLYAITVGETRQELSIKSQPVRALEENEKG